jgi:hypothetical protein
LTQDDELDDELRRLFRDERLDVPPSEGAESAILAGARRVRRRRTALAATGGALTVVVLIGAGLFFGGLRSGNTQTAAPAVQPALSDSGSAPAATPLPLNPPLGSPPTEITTGSESQSSSPLSTERTTASRVTSTTTSPRVDNSLPVSGPVLGPSGYSKLQLGMTFDDAKATGLLAGASTAPTGCTDYTLSEGTAGVRKVTISGTNGIVSFEAAGAHTPERIKVGSTKDQLEAAYPSLAKGGSGYTTSTGAGGTYVFALDSNNKVTDLLLAGPIPC